jgi:hypothetical protein
MQVLLPVLQHAGINSNSLDPSNSYVISLKSGLTIEAKEAPSDFLTISCLLPISAERFTDPETLAILLQTNLLGLEHPPLLTGAIVEQQKIILWGREALVMLDRNATLRLFTRFTEQAERLMQWLALPLEKTGTTSQQHRRPHQTTLLRPRQLTPPSRFVASSSE